MEFSKSQPAVRHWSTSEFGGVEPWSELEYNFMLNIKNSGKHAHTLSNKKNQSNTPFHSQIHPTNVNTWPTRLLRDHVTHSYYEWMDNWINECMTEKMMWWNIRKRNKNTTFCDTTFYNIAVFFIILRNLEYIPKVLYLSHAEPFTE